MLKLNFCLQVTFTVDLRAMDDMGREAVLYELSNRIYQICDRRSVSCSIERKVKTIVTLVLAFVTNSYLKVQPMITFHYVFL